MTDRPQKLSTKIIGILMAFLLTAFLAIGMTLLISWKLEGGAAAINDAGSLRMRSFGIGLLLKRNVAGQLPTDVLALEMAGFNEVLAGLRRGDPLRPLAPPRDNQVAGQLQVVEARWNERLLLLLETIRRGTPDEQAPAMARYDREVEPFVDEINRLVSAMERNYAFNTNLLRTLQVGLIVLAVIGTLILIRFFFVQVIRPVDQLHSGIKRMLAADFSVRLPLESRDEFGALADGFNQMVQHLQNLYSTLEERVDSKTRSLAQRNEELGVLYETTAFLNERERLDELCSGFIQRVMTAMRADGCVIRLQGVDGGIQMIASEGVSQRFVSKENALRCGECLCGGVVLHGRSIQVSTEAPPPEMTSKLCIQEGFRSASAFAIEHQRQTLGLFNLYFRDERVFTDQEMALLETLGKHLGVAVENVRLRAREREAAVYEERNLLAQELHDSIAQGLAFLNIQTQLLQDSLKKLAIDEAGQVAEQIRQGVQESYDDVRELLVHFRTRVSHADIDTAIVMVLERFELQSGVKADFEHTGSLMRIAEDEGIQVLHIVQEALANVRKHAQARHVRLAIDHDRTQIRIRIEDDGIGFDPAQALPDKHIGLRIMKERAARIGGQLNVTSAPGRGTCLSLLLRCFDPAEA